jgi:uncharacterized cupredoxin-like copper-binding protein
MTHVERPARLGVAGMLGLFAAVAATGCGSDEQALGPRADVAADVSAAPRVKAQSKTVARPKTVAVKDRSNAIVTARPTKLILKLSEFSVDPFLSAVPKGRVTISVLNKGQREHELLVVRAKGRLPVKGSRVDEDALERRHLVLGEISDVPAGGSASKTVVLKAGRYYLFCNIPGHFRAGMRASLIVRGR